MISLTITRASLSLPDLVIGDDPGGSLWIAGAGEPGFGFRYNYAPDSDHVPGSALLSAVLEMSSLPVTIYARAASSAALATLRNEVAAAVSQFSYTVTLTVDGIASSFSADPVWPHWQWAEDSGMVAAHMASTSLSIPVNPPGA